MSSKQAAKTFLIYIKCMRHCQNRLATILEYSAPNRLVKHPVDIDRENVDRFRSLGNFRTTAHCPSAMGREFRIRRPCEANMAGAVSKNPHEPVIVLDASTALYHTGGNPRSGVATVNHKLRNIIRATVPSWPMKNDLLHSHHTFRSAWL